MWLVLLNIYGHPGLNQGFEKCMALGAANYLQENFKTCSSLKVSFTNLLLTKDFAF